MNYTFEIIDTRDNSWVTQLVKAKESSVIVEWQGGDKKDELFIVGSSVSFTMMGMSLEDGQFIDLFTGDETRYKVIQKNDNGKILMSWFILPDTYEEPYSNVPILVDFTATDGLGRLKGKYLPEDFYKDEKSVIEIIAACLKLTGLNLSFRFAPAIENSLQKDYNKIYLDTSYFKSKDKKEDAYKILDDLLQSMLCTLYQGDNYFNIEGLNIRNQRVYKAKVYSPSGTLIDEVEITRERVNVLGLGKPKITMQAPYGIVRVEHKREDVSLPTTLSKEENKEWVTISKNEQSIYALEWKSNSNYFAYASTPDYNVYVGKSPTPDSDFVSLRSRPYVKKGSKYRIDLDFTLVQENINDGLRNNLINQGKWDNPFKFRITLTSKGFDGNDKVEILFSNYDVPTDGHKFRDLNFTAEKKTIENTMDFVAQIDGVLDIEVHPVLEANNNGIRRIEISEAEIKEIGFEENRVTEITLTEDYTSKKDIDLIYADDMTGFSKGFRLQKLRDKQDNYKTVVVTGLMGNVERDGKYYLFVDLKEANLVKENINEVYEGPNTKIHVEDVKFNWQDSGEHALQFDSNPNLYTNPSVRVYDFNFVTENRNYWERWTDTIYKVEQIRYPDVVANIINRMFDKPVKSMRDLTVKNNIMFNSFIDFNFMTDTQWMLSNCRWDVDKGYCDISTIENYYAVTQGANIPPIVEAGDDIAIGAGIERSQLTCEAYDPDGYIVSYLWEELTGNGAVIAQPNSQNTQISGLNKDFYTFRVTVTDNNGATASDTVNVAREQPHELFLAKVEDEVDKHVYTVSFEPRMDSSYSLNVKGSFELRSTQGHPYNIAHAAFRVFKNNIKILEYKIGSKYNSTDTSPLLLTDDFSINYIGDQRLEIEIEAYAEIGADSNNQAYAKASFIVDAVEFRDGFGQITNLPQSREKEMIVYP